MVAGDDRPDGWDWVTARAKCSLEKRFELLAELVTAHVNAANALPNHQGVSFDYKRAAPNRFVVMRSQQMGGFTECVMVAFERSSVAIQASEGGPNRALKPLFSATPCFTAEGECLLEIDGQPHRLWQVSRRALETLFFT